MTSPLRERVAKRLCQEWWENCGYEAIKGENHWELIADGPRQGWLALADLVLPLLVWNPDKGDEYLAAVSRLTEKGLEGK